MRGFIVWLTGLSGSGKSTLARSLSLEFARLGVPVEVLDGELIRTQLWTDLGFSRKDRDENVRRIGFIAGLLTRHGINVIVAAISPYREARNAIRLAHPERFIEIFVECPLQALIERDPRGLYRKATSGVIASFTGISDPYEPPLKPEIAVRTDLHNAAENVQSIMQWLRSHRFVV
jgi:adenylylsulfate kinase